MAMPTPDIGARNVVHVDRKRRPDAFALHLGTRCDLIAETHNGDTTTLVIQRRRALRDNEAIG